MGAFVCVMFWDLAHIVPTALRIYNIRSNAFVNSYIFTYFLKNSVLFGTP